MVKATPATRNRPKLRVASTSRLEDVGGSRRVSEGLGRLDGSTRLEPRASLGRLAPEDDVLGGLLAAEAGSPAASSMSTAFRRFGPLEASTSWPQAAAMSWPYSLRSRTRMPASMIRLPNSRDVSSDGASKPCVSAVTYASLSPSRSSSPGGPAEDQGVAGDSASEPAIQGRVERSETRAWTPLDSASDRRRVRRPRARPTRTERGPRGRESPRGRARKEVGKDWNSEMSS